MHDRVFTVGEAARWLAKPNESVESAARQLRHYRKHGFVQSQGTFGVGPTAPNTFRKIDIAVAKLLRSLTAFGIADKGLLKEVSDACYEMPAKGDHNAQGGTPAIVAALESNPNEEFSPHYWALVIDLSEQSGANAVFAEIRLLDRNEGVRDHPALDGTITLPMWHWLRDLEALA